MGGDPKTPPWPAARKDFVHRAAYGHLPVAGFLIAAASLSPRGSAVALVLVLVVFAIPVLVLIGLYATVPYRASEVLGSLRAWMEKHNRVITVVLCFVFGAFFLISGLSGS